ncbi:MAG TPA: hypothetical protein VKE24_13800, partial [Candidatus Acidoferrales bacterium]|nr:hypothetical protein [Candidatus Acidoferrales bacterium]
LAHPLDLELIGMAQVECDAFDLYGHHSYYEVSGPSDEDGVDFLPRRSRRVDFPGPRYRARHGTLQRNAT